MTEDKNNILGCFASFQMYDIRGEEFRAYIWGEKGICEALKTLERDNYGGDLRLILFEFQVNQIPYVLQNLTEFEYRRKEKSIGIPIIVDENNFFSKSHEDRYNFLKTIILQKMDLLSEVVAKKKLDTNVALLKADLEGMFKFIP